MAGVSFEWLDKLRWTREQVATLRERYPEEQLLLSVMGQLDYLVALATGIEKDDSALEEISFGYLAVYPLSDILPHDVSVALCDISQAIKRDLRRQGRRSKHE